MAFWTKTDEDYRAEGAGAGLVRRDPGAGGEVDVLLGAGAEFEGKLTFSGTVRIDAKFKGMIVTNDVLVVGERAKIDADITCGTIVVHGEVNGNIRARNAVELHAPARVRGDVETPSFSLERGVVFEGQTKMPAGEKAQAPARVAAREPTGTSPRASAASGTPAVIPLQ